MVDAGKVTVKVELDASDIPSSLTRSVNSQLKPALARFENEVDKTTKSVKRSVDSIGPSLGGVGQSVSRSLRPALKQVEDDVDKVVSRTRSKVAAGLDGIGGALAGIGSGMGIGTAATSTAAAISLMAKALEQSAVAAESVGSGLEGVDAGANIAKSAVAAVGVAVAVTAAASVAAIATIGASVVVLGKQFYDLGSEADELQDKLLIKTGGSAAEIDKLTDSIQKLGTTNVPMSFDAIGDVALDVTRNLKLAGPALEEVTSRIANLGRMTGEAVNVKAFGDAVKKFKITDQAGAINELNAVSQATGLSFNTLTAALDSGGAAVKAAGFGFGESAALLGQLNEAGIDAAEIMPGITKLLREAPKYGKSGETALSDAVNDIKALSDAGRELEAKGLATKLFGRGSLPLFTAIKEGTLDLNNLKLDGPVQDVNELSDKTADWSERWTTLQNTIKKAFEPFGTAVFDKVNEQLGKLADWITANQDSIVGFFVDLSKVFIDLGSAALRGIGEVVRAVGYLMAPIGDVLGGLATLDAAIADALGKDDDAAASRKQAENFFSWGETLTKVGNAAIEASKGSEAAKDGVDALGKAALEGTDATAGLNAELGALPVDGVNVPLAITGIPEADKAMDDLFTKYRTLSVGVEIGDPAAAGVLGGGMLGANVDPNVSGDAARKYAHDVMQPFWESQGFTVGDHAADKYGEHQHGALDVMVNSIAEGQKVLQQALKDPNAYGIIFNNQTYGYGHGPTPQDYTAGHTGDPSQDHTNHVHIWYKPGDTLPPGVPPPPRSANDPQAGANLDKIPVTTPPNLPTPPAATPGMPTPVDPGAAPVPITVAPIEVPVVPLFTTPGDDPQLNALQAQADAANNAQRAKDASKARTAAAQAVADATAKVKADQAAVDAITADSFAKPEARTKADADLLASTKALTEAQQAEAELITKQGNDALNDQIAARKQATKTQDAMDYTKLPLGDSRRIAAQAFMGAGGTAEEFAALMGGNAAPPVATTASILQAAGQPLGQAAGDAAAAAITTSLLPVGTPTAPDTETNRLLAERNPAVVAKLAGLDVPDYTRQGGDPGEVMAAGGPGFTALGQMMSDTAAMIDRTLTSMEASNQARQDQLLSILQQIGTKVGADVLAPIVTASTESALTGIAADVGTAMGETAGPIIGDKTAAAVAEQQSSTSGTSALPGMAGGGGIFGGTPGKDSVPAMLMPGEWVLTTADVARLGGFAGVERLIAGLQSNGGMRLYASGGGVGRATTGNPNGGQNVNSTVGADFFGVSQIPVLAAAINALTAVLLKIIDVEIMQRDALIEVTKEFRDFRGDFKAFDAAGRIKNDNSGLSDRTSSSQKQAADERLRILKMVIDGLVKYIIERVLVPLGKAIGNAIVSALAGAAGGAIAGGGGSIAGGIASAAISAAGAVAIDIAAEIFTIAAETLITIGLDVIGEFLQTLFPQLTTSLLGGAVMEQIAGPVSAVMTNAIGVVTSLTTNLLGNLGGLFANFIPTFQGFLSGFVPLTASLTAVVGVLSSIAAVLQQILTALLNLGAGIASPIVAAVTSALGGFIPLVSSLGTTTNLLGTVATVLNSLVQGIQSLIPRLPGVPGAASVLTTLTAIVPSQPIVDAVALGVRPLTGAVSGMTSSVASFIKPIEGLSATIVGTNSLAAAVADMGAAVGTFSTAVAKPIDVLFTAISGTNRLAAPTTTTTSTTINAPIMVTATKPLTAATTIANRLLALTG